VLDAAGADTNRGYSSLGANQRFTFFTRTGSSRTCGTNSARTSPRDGEHASGSSIFPYDVNWAGPRCQALARLRKLSVSLEHRFSDSLIVQAIYFKNNTFARARSFVYQGNVMDFLGDPNQTILGQSGTGNIPNPRAGQLYIETNQNDDRTDTENEIKRLTIAYELKLGKWFGNHRFAGLYENAVQDRATLSRREILVDQLNRPVANATPENAQNLVYRRSYVTEGDFSTYAHTGLYTPLAPFTYNGLTWVHAWSTPANSSRSRTSRATCLPRRAPGSPKAGHHAGLSSGRYRLSRHPSGRVAAGDPGIASGQLLVNEVTALPQFDRNTIKPTRSLPVACCTCTSASPFFITNPPTRVCRAQSPHSADGQHPGTPEAKAVTWA
jgi:hypothetical protein